MSHGFGSTKQPDACSARKVAAADFCIDPMAQQYTCSGEGTMLRKSKAAHALQKRKREMEHREDGHVLECVGVPPLLPISAIPKKLRSLPRSCAEAAKAAGESARSSHLFRSAFQICRSGPLAP